MIIQRLKKAALSGCLAALIMLGALSMNIYSARQTDETTAAGTFSVSAESAVLIEAESGKILYEKNAYEKRPMASTTKIMTGLLAIENYDLQSVVTVSHDAVGVEGSSIYLREDERLPMEELVYALMLESANDAAAAIAIAVGGSIGGFAEMMNSKAREIGLENTSFENPHGLDSENHYTTAYDLARLSAYALENPAFSRIVSTHKRILKTENGDITRLLVNHNRLLNAYDGIIGVKTGYTRRSGRCLVSAAERDGVRLVAVTLNAPDDWNDHRRMLDYGFDICENVVIESEGGFSIYAPVVGGEYEFVRCTNKSLVCAVMLKNHPEITRSVELRSFYYAPVRSGDCLGKVVWYCGGERIAETELIASDTVEPKEVRLTFKERIKKLFGML